MNYDILVLPGGIFSLPRHSHCRQLSAAELLDACDLIFCLDWACVDARLYQFAAPAGMNGGVVQERHKSLNWLIGYGNSNPWDEVKTDT